MSTQTAPLESSGSSPGTKPTGPVAGRRMPAVISWLLAAGSLGLGALLSVALTGGLGITLAVVIGAVIWVIANWLVARSMLGRRQGTDRLVTSLVTMAFIIALIPLVSVVYTAISRGYARFDVAFFTETLEGVLGPGGGAAHAIVGTLIITAIASVISIPIGILAAVYLVEYGKGRLKRAITFLVDVMTGIPSIVAGLFAFALFSILLGDPGHRSGLAGGIALSVLMIPVVVRSVEEMLKLVPNELREASYALGIPKWLTITKVVIPTSIAGIASGVTISIARVIGETAPLLVVAGFTFNMSLDATAGRMMSLPVYIYSQFATPSLPPQASYDRAWTAALVLIIIVMVLNLGARTVAAFFAPKSRA